MNAKVGRTARARFKISAKNRRRVIYATMIPRKALPKRHMSTRLGRNRAAVTYSVGAHGIEVHRVYNLTHGFAISLTLPMVEAFSVYLAERLSARRRAA